MALDMIMAMVSPSNNRLKCVFIPIRFKVMLTIE